MPCLANSPTMAASIVLALSDPNLEQAWCDKPCAEDRARTSQDPP